MNNDACPASVSKWRENNPGFEEQMKFYQHKYADKLPVELLWSGGIANILYKKEIKLGVYAGIYIEYEFKDGQEVGLGYKFSF